MEYNSLAHYHSQVDFKTMFEQTVYEVTLVRQQRGGGDDQPKETVVCLEYKHLSQGLIALLNDILEGEILQVYIAVDGGLISNSEYEEERDQLVNDFIDLVHDVAYGLERGLYGQVDLQYKDFTEGWYLESRLLDIFIFIQPVLRSQCSAVQSSAPGSGAGAKFKLPRDYYYLGNNDPRVELVDKVYI